MDTTLIQGDIWEHIRQNFLHEEREITGGESIMEEILYQSKGLMFNEIGTRVEENLHNFGHFVH